MPRGVAQERIENHTARVWHKYNKRYGISAYYCCTYRHTLLELYLHFRKQKRSWKPCGTTTPLLLTESFNNFLDDSANHCIISGGMFTCHTSGHEVFKNSRVGSGRVGSGEEVFESHRSGWVDSG